MTRSKKGHFEPTQPQNRKQPAKEPIIETTPRKKVVEETTGIAARATATENSKVNKPSEPISVRRKAFEPTPATSSSPKIEMEDSKKQTKQTLPEKTKNQQEEASNTMKTKPSSEDKSAKNKIRKLRAVSSSPPPADLENEIRERAYQISLKNPSQSPEANWLKAEAEVKEKYNNIIDE